MPNHHVVVTISDPSHNISSRRKETQTKHVNVAAKSHEEALTKARKYYENMKYKVHNCNLQEENQQEEYQMPSRLDELSKKLLGNYIKSASFDKSDRAHEIGYQNALGVETGRARDKDFHDDQRKHGSSFLAK